MASSRLEGEKLHLKPCLPADWTAFKMRYRYRETLYHIDVAQLRDASDGKAGVTVDGVEQPDGAIRLADDRQEHRATVTVIASVASSV